MGLNFQALAEVCAAASKDPRHKIGAVIFDSEGGVLSTGYNGAPRRVNDAPERYEKPLKQFYIVHAEANAIAHAARKGIALENSAILITGKPPCARCAQLIIQAGIKLVMFSPEKNPASNWQEDFKHATAMLKEAGIKLSFI